MKIVVAESELRIGRKKLRPPIYLEDLTQTLGRAERVKARKTPLDNTIVTWDRLGVVAYEGAPGDPVLSIEFCFQHAESDFAPTQVFSSAVELRGVSLSSDPTEDDLTLAGLKEDKIVTGLYVGKEGDFQIIAEVEDRLVSFSINRKPE